MKDAERKPANAGYEEMAGQMIGLGFSPEEYAARFGHKWMCFSMGEARFADPATDAWIQRLDAIFFHRNGAPTMEECRAKYLTAEERTAIEKELKEMEEVGF
jgi:hypothetical protein